MCSRLFKYVHFVELFVGRVGWVPESFYHSLDASILFVIKSWLVNIYLGRVDRLLKYFSGQMQYKYESWNLVAI